MKVFIWNFIRIRVEEKYDVSTEMLMLLLLLVPFFLEMYFFRKSLVTGLAQMVCISRWKHP